jgi:hypothetical protein
MAKFNSLCSPSIFVNLLYINVQIFSYVFEDIMYLYFPEQVNVSYNPKELYFYINYAV